MSMTAVIKKLGDADLGGSNASFDQGLQKIKDSILGGWANIESEHVNDNIVVRGIVQNEMTLTAVNNWNTSLYSGISEALEGVNVGGGLIPGSVKGSSILKLANTVASATGYNISGTGPASKKIYQGSNLSGFGVTFKWYTPKSTHWKEQISNLASLAWPVYMGKAPDVSPLVNNNTPNSTFTDRVKGVVEGVIDIAGGAINNLIARNPEKVMLTIFYGNDDGPIMYQMTPLVITSFTLQGSRETYQGVPVIVTATVNFDYYQINASGSTAIKQYFGGAPIFATPQIKSELKPIPTNGSNNGLASGDRVQVAPGSRSVRIAQR